MGIRYWFVKYIIAFSKRLVERLSKGVLEGPSKGLFSRIFENPWPPQIESFLKIGSGIERMISMIQRQKNGV